MQKVELSTMEHRYNKRFPLAMEVVIYQDGVPTAVGMTQNLSSGGAYVLMEKGNFRRHAALEVELNTSVDTSRPRIQGEVVYCNRHGFGMTFNGVDEEMVAVVKRSAVNESIAC
jgi:hypothetical protein